MDNKELKELMSSFDNSGISELKWSDGQTNLILKKNGEPAPVPVAPASAADNQTQEAGKASAESGSGTVVRSPLVGVFYAAPAPGEAPFVKEGQSVCRGDVICLVEAMKMMNEIKAPSDGVIKKILVENGETVSYNQPLAELGD